MIDVQKLAREAGLGTVLSHNGGSERVWIEGADWHDELERFAALVLEDAAKACDEQYYKHIGPAYGEVRYGITACSASIRSLKPAAIKEARLSGPQ